MENYNNSKNVDVVSGRNMEESEERQEILNTVYFDSSCVNIKSIHSKRKDHR